MRMSAADQRTYPKAARYIRYDLPSVANMPVVASAMQKTGQLSQAAFASALTWGNNPSIRIVVMAACGQFTPTPGNNVIEIAKRVFVGFERGRGLLAASSGPVYALGINLLHELVHWGDNLDGVDRPGEEGDEFEQLIYGVNLGC